MITPLPGRDADQAGLGHVPAARHHRRHRRRDRRIGRPRQGRHPRDQETVAGDAAHDLGRSRALQEDLLSRRTSRASTTSRATARRTDEDGYYPHHGPHRRRAERRRPPARHDGDRVGAGRESEGRRSRGGRPPRRPDRRSDRRVRRAQAGAARRRATRSASSRSCRTGSARRSAPIAKPQDIRFGDNLPKTRSGKIMRRLLRSIAKGEDDHAGRLDARESRDPRAAEAAR